MAFGRLYFCSFDFFVLISRIENTFRVLLSEEALLIHGSFLLEKIRRNIFLSEIFKLELSSFLPKNLETEQRNIIAVYLVSIYTRMRCKDFAYKLLKNGSKLKICTRSLQAALSNPAYRSKKQAKYNSRLNDIDNIVHELIEDDDECMISPTPPVRNHIKLHTQQSIGRGRVNVIQGMDHRPHVNDVRGRS